MISEAQRRAYLKAMQVDTWLPRVPLPFAAPSRLELVEAAAQDDAQRPDVALDAQPEAAPASSQPAAAVLEALRGAREPAPVRSAAPAETIEPAPTVEPSTTETADSPEPAAAVAPPRFALQLLRAGACLLVAELPTGEPFASRDPAYLLLKDILRAAGLPDSPQQVGDGEPIRWPLMRAGNLDQGPQAALDYVQGVIAAELDQQPSACLWLIGIPALRFAGEADESAFNRELNVEGLGAALAMPGLETLMEEPQHKAPLWRALQRSMARWKSAE